MITSFLLLLEADHWQISSTGKTAHTELLIVFTDLASAIDAMHKFNTDTIDPRSGCHRDIASRNILIHENTFRLTDFGLSTFKSLSCPATQHLRQHERVKGSR
jgi:serine/threonine protein kinase